VHRELGPGLLESAYEHCLAYEVGERGLPVRAQVTLPIIYGSQKLDAGYRLDLIVDDRVIVEVKAVDALAPIHEAQLITYLRLSRVRLGYLLNFNSVLLRDGMKRRVL
jgi:GxxExxY protein